MELDNILPDLNVSERRQIYISRVFKKFYKRLRNLILKIGRPELTRNFFTENSQYRMCGGSNRGIEMNPVVVRMQLHTTEITHLRMAGVQGLLAIVCVVSRSLNKQLKPNI